MKNFFIPSIVVAILSTNCACGQAQPTKQYTFVFDYTSTSKTWSYDGPKITKKQRPYFLVPYKSQPVIKITNLPSGYTVEIESSLFDIVPQTEKKEDENKKQQLAAKELEALRVADQIRQLDFARVTGAKQLKNYDTLRDSLSNELQKIAREKAQLTNQLNALQASVQTYVQTMKMVDGDEVEYTVTIKAEDKSVAHTTTIFAKIYGGLKLDLSGGVLFHTLANYSYHYEPAETNKSKIVEDGEREKVKPLFPVVLMHAYPRPKGFVGPGVSFGLGIDDSGKAGYYVGGALMVGDRQRFIVSAGPAFRSVDILKGKYSIDESLDDATKPAETDLVNSKYKFGFFFSLTYNFTTELKKRK